MISHSLISIKIEQIDSGNAIKIATYNIYEYDLIHILPVLEDLDADVLALQEVEFSE